MFHFSQSTNLHDFTVGPHLVQLIMHEKSCQQNTCKVNIVLFRDHAK